MANLNNYRRSKRGSRSSCIHGTGNGFFPTGLLKRAIYKGFQKMRGNGVPHFQCHFGHIRHFLTNKKTLVFQGFQALASQEGFEPPTYGLEVRCSIQLSYWDVSAKIKTFIIKDYNVLPLLSFMKNHRQAPTDYTPLIPTEYLLISIYHT